jgi:G protein beta subunit-like protein
MSQQVVLATGGFDHKIRFWDPKSGANTRTVRFGEVSQVNCLQISRDKSTVAAGGNPQIQIYDINSNNDNSVHTFDGHTQNVTGLGFQIDGKFIYSCSEDGTMKIWDLRTPSCELSNDCRSPINTIALTPNQEVITGDQNGCVKVWDLYKNTNRATYCPASDVPVRSISVVHDLTCHFMKT